MVTIFRIIGKLVIILVHDIIFDLAWKIQKEADDINNPAQLNNSLKRQAAVLVLIAIILDFVVILA